MTEREFWVEIRRGFLTTISALRKLRPDAKYTIQVKIVEAQTNDVD